MPFNYIFVQRGKKDEEFLFFYFFFFKIKIVGTVCTKYKYWEQSASRPKNGIK